MKSKSVALFCLFLLFFFGSTNLLLRHGGLVDSKSFKTFSTPRRHTSSPTTKAKIYSTTTETIPLVTTTTAPIAVVPQTTGTVVNLPTTSNIPPATLPLSFSTTSTTAAGSVSGYVLSMSCPTATICYGAGVTADTHNPMIVKSLNDGNSWQELSYGNISVTTLTDITCMSLNFCYAVGSTYYGFSGIVISTLDGGNTWEVAYTGGGDFNSIDCTTNLTCIAVFWETMGNTAVGDITTNGFSTVTSILLPQLFNLPSEGCSPAGCIFLDKGIHCLGTDFCAMYGTLKPPMNPAIAFSQFGAIAITTDGGSSWEDIPAPIDIYRIENLSCFSTQECLATGINRLSQPVIWTVTYSDTTRTWTVGQPYVVPSQIASINGLYCYNSNICVGVGASSNNDPEIFVSTDLGTSWTIQTLSSQLPSLLELSCLSTATAQCIAMGTMQDLSSSEAYLISFVKSSSVSSSTGSFNVNILPNAMHQQIIVMGDSHIMDLGLNGISLVGSDYYATAYVGAMFCGITNLATQVIGGTQVANGSQCVNWQSIYQNDINSNQNAKYAILGVGRWDALSWMLAGQEVGFGDPSFNSYYQNSLQTAINILSTYGAHVFVMSAPYLSIATQANGTPYRGDDNQRISIVNSIDQTVVNNSGGKASFLNLNSVECPNNTFQLVDNGITVRESDGIHLTVQGEVYLGNWILNQIDTNY